MLVIVFVYLVFLFIDKREEKKNLNENIEAAQWLDSHRVELSDAEKTKMAEELNKDLKKFTKEEKKEAIEFLNS